MSTFEDYLSMGSWLSESQQLAIFKYLLRSRESTYKTQATQLLNIKTLETTFANGEIFYELSNGEVYFRARLKGVDEYDRVRRSIKLGKFKMFKIRKLVKFFAQSEIDVLRNFPIPKEKPFQTQGFSMNVYPYYDLNYYSNGKGAIAGFIKKVQSKDDELLERLLAS